jgi:hypothetical protein
MRFRTKANALEHARSVAPPPGRSIHDDDDDVAIIIAGKNASFGGDGTGDR